MASSLLNSDDVQWCNFHRILFVPQDSVFPSRWLATCRECACLPFKVSGGSTAVSGDDSSGRIAGLRKCSRDDELVCSGPGHRLRDPDLLGQAEGGRPLLGNGLAFLGIRPAPSRALRNNNSI
jgi:hypothetical protein